MTPYTPPVVPIEIAAIQHPGEVPDDKIIAAYNGGAMAKLHESYNVQGPQRMPIRMDLSRYDCDLIHNHIATVIDPTQEMNETHHALMRFAAKAAIVRDWIKKQEVAHSG